MYGGVVFVDAWVPTFDARHGADLTDGPTMHFEIAPCKEIRQRTDAVGMGLKENDV